MRSPGRSGLLLIPVLISISVSSFGQSVWFEDFESGAETTSGNATGSNATAWDALPSPSGGAASFTRINAGVPYGGIFFINQTGTEGVWETNLINISTLGDVALEITVGGLNATASDYVRAYYRINGGPEILFGQATGAPGLVVFTAASAIVSGNDLRIVVRGFDGSGGGGAMGFDNVTVSDIEVLYSRANTAWDVGTTWSRTSLGGASCGCTPDGDTRVIIGNNNTVTLPANGTTAGLEIRNTGQLVWTNNTVSLAMARGGVLDVQSGGILSRAAMTGSTINFANYSYSVQNAGTLNIGALVYAGSGNSTLTNSGTMTLATTIGLSITGGNGYTFTNTGTLNFADLSIGGADITVNNSGTINQSGNFTGVDTGSSFNNLAGGTWNFGGTVTTNVRLFANNNSNTFNYDRATAQTILVPQASTYSNLTLSGGGAKSVTAPLTVNGNWTRSGTATYTHNNHRITLNGSIPQTISAVGGETFRDLTINNTSATSPQIILNNSVTVTTNLTMTDGNVDLNGNNFNLSSSAAAALTHSLASTAGWMYGGSITRAFPTTAIAVGNVAGYFPMGTATNSRPFFLGKNNPANSNGTLTISYSDANSATNVSFNDGATPIQRRHDAFWHVTKTIMTAGTFDINAGGTGFTIGAFNETRLTRQNDAIGIGTAAASVAPATDIRVRRTGVPAAGLANDFYLASTNSVNSPLPVELDFFQARVDGDIVIASWRTLQEKNNDYFTVEKTVDFETFYEVGRHESKGNDADGNSYSIADDLPFAGRSYYRLKQTDFDGTFKYSSPVTVEFSGPASGLLKAYPNPSDGESITLEVRGISGVSVIPVSIYNQQGQKVMEVLIDEAGPGVFRKQIILAESLAPGMYILKAGRTRQLTGKLVVK